MSEFWKFLGDHWLWLVFLACAGGAEWVADRFDSGIAVFGRRHARAARYREALCQLELEARRRELEAVHPRTLEPICGCGHELAFHTVQTDICHHPADGAACPCQRYTGPELLGQVYVPPLADPERGIA